MRHAAVLVVAIFTSSAAADLGDQLFKLLAEDGMGFDVFGSAVAVSGNRAIVGAPDDGDYDNLSGSAYVFDTNTGRQLVKLIPDDPGFRHFFGASVGISNSIAIVGSPFNNDSGCVFGSAYLFDATTGRQLFKLIPDDCAEFANFGSCVAIHESIAIVGSAGDGENGDFSGAAYLFDTATGRQLFKLLPGDGAEFDFFGIAVGISGGIAIVGSMGDDDNGNGSGSAYVFDTTTGQQLLKLSPDDGSEADLFGASVAIDSDTAIVGAVADDDNGEQSGSAYIFDMTTGEQLFKLLPNDGSADDRFGDSVAISGETAIAGAHFHDGNRGFDAGTAYVFNTTSGQQLFELLPGDIEPLDGFGSSVAINGSTIIIGAPFEDDNGDFAGSAYIFDASTCPADIDGDGDADAEDFFAYLDLFASGDPRADIDGDGDIDADDFFAYLDFFTQPCG